MLLVVAVGPRLDDRLAVEPGLLPERARVGRDRRRDLRLRRQLGRALVRPDQLRRGRRVRRRCDDGAARVEEGRADARSSRSCATTRSATCPRSCSRLLLGGLFAFVVGLPLMRLTRARGRDRDVRRARDHAQHPPRVDKIGPGATTLSLVPESTGPRQGTIGALVVIAVAFAYQRSRLGRQLRASREDPAAARGVGVRRPPRSGSGRSRSRARWPGSRAGCSCTSSARSRPSRSTSS